MDATFTTFGIDDVCTPAGGEPLAVRVIAKRPNAIVGSGETRMHTETATFELRTSEVASPRPGDQLTFGGESFVVQGEPERRDPDRLVWTVDARASVIGLALRSVFWAAAGRILRQLRRRRPAAESSKGSSGPRR